MKKQISLLNTHIICVVLILVLFQVISASRPDFLVSEEINLSFSENNQTEEIKPGETYLRQMEGGQKHFFLVRAKKGNCLRFTFEQKGIDIMIAVKENTGEKKEADIEILKAVDRPSGSFGRETVTFIVPESRVYAVEIKSWLADAINGNYQFSYTEAEAVTESDRKRSLAEDLTSQAELLRANGLKENKEKGLAVFSDALKIWQELGDLYEQSVIYYGIGFTQYGLGNHYEAARFYNRALKLHLQTGNEFGEGVNLAALGAINYALNDNELSAYYYKRAIEIYKKIGNVRGLGIAFHGIGTEQLLSEKYDDAVKSLTESLRFRVLANDSRGRGYTHITLGKLYLSQKKYNDARDHLIEAQKSFGEKRSANEPELLYYFGKYYLSTGDLVKAEDYLKESQRFYTAAGNKVGEANCLIELSRISTRTNEFEKGIAEIKRSLELIEEIRRSNPNFRTRVNFSSTIQPFYEQYILLLMKMHESKPDKAFNEKALEISEQARARGLLDQLERRKLIRQNLIPPELLLREQKLRDNLIRLLSISANNNQNRYTMEFLDASTEFAETEAEINQKFSSPEIPFLPTLKTREIAGYLDKNTALLEYWITGEESFLFLVTKSGVKSFRLEAGDKIDFSAREVFDCISKPQTPAVERKCREKNLNLSKMLLGGAAREIQNKRLFVIKHGILQHIPFAALLNPETERYLIKTNEIGYLPSFSVFGYLNRPISPRQEKTVAVFADPVYSSDDGRIAGNKPDKIQMEPDLPRLFASRFEAEAIASYVKPQHLIVKMDTQASRENVFNSSLNDFQIIHFAAHTLTDDRNPELSAIMLSRYDKNGNRQNDFLRINDILRLDLDADLVVLSSCRSGSGRQIKGEGLMSLANGFFAAGARRLLSSLWEADDKVTAELMKRFYQKHLGENKSVSAALRQSQVEIMEDNRWKSPFYWSGFFLQGS